MGNDETGKAQLSLLAHDLRTPLTAMRITAELIGNGPLTAQQQEQLAILITSIDALADMTGTLLHGPVPENGAQAREPIAEIARQTCDLFRFTAERKGLTLEFVSRQGDPRGTTSNGPALRRVLGALLDNAVKYTAAGGIEVIFDERRITVTDTGPGIPASEQAMLFRPFTRGNAGRDSGSGSGLGLWGAHETMRRIGGGFVLHSEGGGCRFEIVLPKESDGAQEINPGLADQGGALQPAHVLIVDDNETNCRLLSALLESFQVTSDAAFSGPDAIELARTNRYDAALLDLHMPGMNGFETAQELRRLRSAEDLPLIAVTAAVEAIGKNASSAKLFQDVLEKPLVPAALFRAMERAGAANRTGA